MLTAVGEYQISALISGQQIRTSSGVAKSTLTVVPSAVSGADCRSALFLYTQILTANWDVVDKGLLRPQHSPREMGAFNRNWGLLVNDAHLLCTELLLATNLNQLFLTILQSLIYLTDQDNLWKLCFHEISRGARKSKDC